MKITVININNIKIWLSIQQFLHYKNGKIADLVCDNEYVCYFKFSEPSDIILGELILDENKKIKLFKSIEEAEIFGMEYIQKRILH